MKTRRFVRFLLAAALLGAVASGVAQAAPRRQYYNDWNFYPQFGYYYISYYYQPSPRDAGYKYQFCLFYPSNPRFVYYFDPVRHLYWGRLDMKGTPDHQFSLLAEKDRKEKLKDIPEEAFPEARQDAAHPGIEGRHADGADSASPQICRPRRREEHAGAEKVAAPRDLFRAYSGSLISRRQEDQLELHEFADQAPQILRPAERLLGQQTPEQIGQLARSIGPEAAQQRGPALPVLHQHADAPLPTNGSRPVSMR